MFSRRATTSTSASLSSASIAVVRVDRSAGVEVPRRVVPEHEHRTGRRRAARSSSHSSCSRGSAPPTCPGPTVSSTASVTPSSSTAYGAPSTRQRRVEHRVVVAAHVVHARRRARRTRRGTPRTPRPCRVSVRSPFTTTASGSSARISSIDRAVHHLGVRRLAGLGAQDRADRVGGRIAGAPALGLAEVHVVGGGDRREQPPGGRASVRTAAGQPAVGRDALDRELVLGVGLEAGDARDVVRTGRSTTSWSPTRVGDRRVRRRS